MKIAYIHSGFFPSNSPCMTFTTLNAIALAEVFEHCYFFIKRNSNDSSAEILKKHFNLKQPQNLSIYQIKNNKFINTNYFYFKNVYHKIENLIARNKLRVVISRNITFLPYLAKIKKKFGVATYFETHDFYADLSVRNDVNKNKKARYERIERKYIPQISGVFCLQHAQKELYQKIFPEQKFFVVRTGLDKINRHSNNKRFYLSYVGSFDAHKGVDIFIKAFNLSKSKPPSLIIGGKDDNEIATIKRLLSRDKNQGKVKIFSWLNKRELAHYLSRTAVGVIPLKDTFFNRYLTSPLKLFDFYSHGIPVIATDLPTNRELIIENKTGVFFEPDNPFDLAQKIDMLFSSSEKLTELSENIYDFASQHRWKNRAQQILKIVNEQN